jgi:hypothetical protein
MALIRRKITLPILIVLAVAAIGVAIAETIVAQSGGKLADDLQPKEGDAEAMATVQDQDVTRGDVRRMVEFQRMTDGSMTKDAAVGKSIVIVIDGFITEAEVNRRELTPTSEEARDYMNRQRDFCLGEGGVECRAHIERLGFDPNSDEYWEDIGRLEYGKAVGEIKLFRAIVVERGMEDASNEDHIALRNGLSGELRSKAKIVWHDEDLEKAYQRALASE